MVAEGHASATQNTQVTDARRIETHYGDLDDAYDEDELEAIREALTYSKADERAGRPNPAKFTIDGDLYSNLAHFRSTLSFYARFRKATDGIKTSAENIDKRIELFDDAGNAHWPVRQMDQNTGDIAFRIRGASNRTVDAEKTTDILAVGRALFREGRAVRVVRSNNDRRPYLGYGKQKLTSYKMTPDIAAALGLPAQGSIHNTTSFLDLLVLEKLRQQFLNRYPDFEPQMFAASSGGYFDDERRYKDALLVKAQQAIADETSLSDEELGGRFLDLLTSPESGVLGWRTDARIKNLRQDRPGELESEAGALVRSRNDLTSAAEQFVTNTWPILIKGQEKSLPYSESRNIPSMLLAFAQPAVALGINTEPLSRIYKALTNKNLFGWNPLSAAEYSETLSFAQSLFDKFEEWGWQPRDLWDVQSFIWAVKDTAKDKTEDSPSHDPEARNSMPKPTNLILYGPPGTGKTYHTTEAAVRLCDGTVPMDRSEIKARYDVLVETGQIGFVTFHQSYAYEDFVEGLRPVTGSDEGDDESPSAGFRLEPKRGIFREMCTVAEEARKNAGRKGGFDIHGRKVFKMSLGRAGLEDHIYDDAIENNYIVLGWGGEVDWSDAQFGEWPNLLERWKQEDPTATGNDANVVQMWPFRSSMEIGDLVVVSAGNRYFRAIGEIVGDYEYLPTEIREYNHRRSVRWLLVPDEPLPVEMIYGKNFMMQSCYQMKDTLLKKDALSRLLPGDVQVGNASPDQFVLIIDEINRANISKVFGELITLIEDDKRLGCENAMTVKLPYSGDPFGIPANLHIIGTMNTADRSIALLDTALRRRFTFRELMPDPELLAEAVARTSVPLIGLLRTLNERIEYLFDREHQIGHAYFIKCGSIDDVHETMRHRVIPLLAEYFYEDWNKVALVLGDADGAGRFVTRTPLSPPTGMQSDGFSEERYRWKVRESFDDDAYAIFG